MPPVKPLQDVVDKWDRRASVAGPDYERGVRNPRKSWAESTVEALDRQAQGIQAAIADGRVERGIRNAGDQEWQAGAISKGVQRFPQGVRVSKGKFQARVSRFLDRINRTNLPPRGPKGSDANIERVRAMNQALRDEKLQGG